MVQKTPLDEKHLESVLEHERTGEKRSNWKAEKNRKAREEAAAGTEGTSKPKKTVASKTKTKTKKKQKVEEKVIDEPIDEDDEDDMENDEDMVLLSEESSADEEPRRKKTSTKKRSRK